MCNCSSFRENCVTHARTDARTHTHGANNNLPPGSKDKLKDSTELQWVDSEFSILGLTFSTRLIDIPNLNFNTALDKAKKVVSSWSYRQWTPLGKTRPLPQHLSPAWNQ